MKGKFIDLTGKTFNEFLVVRKTIRRNGSLHWECMCSCGKTLEVSGSSLRLGTSKSCGCHRLKVNKLGLSRRRHGMTRTKPYKSWAHMLERCNNSESKSYKDYGGRGITVCKKWEKFDGFWEDMQEGYSDGLTIDRIDVNGNYEKDNCKWSTHQEQSDNRRNTIMVTLNGETEKLSYFLEKYNKKRYQYYGRIRSGWSIEDALAKPIKELTRKSAI